MTHKIFKKESIYVLLYFIFLCTQCQSNKDNNKAIVEEKAHIKPLGSLDSIATEEQKIQINLKTQADIDADIDTSIFQKRLRFACNTHDLWAGGCVGFLDSSLVDRQLMRKLLLCKDNENTDEIAYHMHLEPCDNMRSNKIRIFTLDRSQKDSSVLLVSICEGDDADQDPRTNLYESKGVFLVFKKKDDDYKITDAGFGIIAAFDFDKNDKMYPIIYGRTFSNILGNDPSHLEVRFIWDGNHLKSDEVIFFNMNFFFDNFMSSSDIKRSKKYSYLAKNYLKNSEEIQKGVKIHWRNRSFSLKQRNINDPKSRKFYRDSIWNRGLKID
jgi:hypothetical protein